MKKMLLVIFMTMVWFDVLFPGVTYATRTITITPKPVQPELAVIHQITGPDTVLVNTLSSAFIVTFSSAKPTDTVKVKAIWGDGKSDSSTHITVQNQQFAGFFWHTWTSTGTYTVRFEAINSDGFVFQNKTVVVIGPPNQLPIIDSLIVPTTAMQWSVVNMTLVCHDPDSPTLNIDINFGDGSPHFSATRTGSLGQVFTIEFAHTFVSVGQFTITAAVSDTSGGQSIFILTGGSQ